MTILTDWRAFALVCLGIGFAISDLWHFHAVDSQTDLAILFAAFGGGGISVAHTAGANAANKTP
jgi:hypothetical protein